MISYLPDPRESLVTAHVGFLAAGGYMIYAVAAIIATPTDWTLYPLAFFLLCVAGDYWRLGKWHREKEKLARAS